MILCPSCGVRNRRGSKYCYRCGQRLDVNFDVSCPSCDRLNPAGSAFCAFCGAAMGAVPSTGAPAVTPQPHGGASTRPALESNPQSVEPVAESEHEVPPWLYEQAAGRPAEKARTPAGEPGSATRGSPAQSKYLNDIPGALPKTEGWLSSATKSDKPAENEPQPTRPRGQGGCLTLVLATLLAVAGLALMVVI